MIDIDLFLIKDLQNIVFIGTLCPVKRERPTQGRGAFLRRSTSEVYYIKDNQNPLKTTTLNAIT